MKKLNNFGIAHLLIPVIAVVAIAAIGGVYMLVSSSAASKGCVSRTFSSGSSGGCVKYIQIMSGWHPTKADGEYGINTKNSVAVLQGNYGMSKDGVVGKKTWRMLCYNGYTKVSGSAQKAAKKAGCTKAMATKTP